MSRLLAIPCLRLVLEYYHLVSLALVNDVSEDPGSLDRGLSHNQLVPVRNEVNPIQGDSLPFDGKLLDVDNLAGGDPVLFAACLNYRVDWRPPKPIYYVILPTPTLSVKLKSLGDTQSPGRGVLPCALPGRGICVSADK